MDEVSQGLNDIVLESESENKEEDDADEEGDEEEEEEEDDKPPEWRNSKARDYLYGLLKDKRIPGRHDIKPKQVFEEYCISRPEFKHFQDYKALGFASKLMYLRNKLDERTGRAQEDAEALAHDRLIFPPHTEDTKGRPVWAGSRSQELLRKDIAEGKHNVMKPKDLYETREDYYELFDPDFFRNKIYQEVKAAKRVVWVTEKAEKKENKKK